MDAAPARPALRRPADRIASSPFQRGVVELTIDRLEDGEVSPYFHDVLVEGDHVELRGPFASFFVWRGESPVVLVAGGSGVVPLMAMLRHRRSVAPELPMRLLYAVRGADDVIYANDADDGVTLTYMREPPPGWSGHTGRIDAEFVAAAEPAGATCFVCGTNGFVSAASSLLIEAGADRPMIRTERFGPNNVRR